jgi:hypothetical protein
LSFEIFIRKWARPGYPLEAVSRERLEQTERRFSFRYPADYLRAVEQFGLPCLTIALLEAIVERRIDLDCVNEFLNPEETVEVTMSWRGLGLPTNLIAFATDQSGNLFCFDTNELPSEENTSSTVWFYDHDFDTTKITAPNFVAWIEAFCGIEPVTFT